MDVAAYLDRIKYNGKTSPTAENLNSLFSAHRQHIPSTNLDSFGGEVRQFCLENMYDAIIRKKRGGICYEVNSLFNWLLNRLGFRSHMVQSGFYFKERSSFGEKFSHMSLLVTIDDGPAAEEYVVNLAYSDAMPLKLNYAKPQIQHKGIFRVRVDPKNSDCYYVERHRKTVVDITGKLLKRGPGEPGTTSGKCSKNCSDPKSGHWVYAFRFSPEAHLLSEFEEAYRAQVFNPESFLRNNLRMLFNNDAMSFKLVANTLTISVPCDAVTDRIVATAKVKSDDEVEGIAHDIFGLAKDFEVKFFRRPQVQNGFGH